MEVFRISRGLDGGAANCKRRNDRGGPGGVSRESQRVQTEMRANRRNQPMSEKFDAIIIGTGQSGPSLAARLTKEGMKTAIIERKRFGGTCVNVGCIPTKTLVASARAVQVARRGAEFGVIIDGPINVDMKRVKARKDAVVRQSNEGVTKWLKNMDNLTVYESHARLESADSVSVNGALLQAERIFLNVGARAAVPDIPGLDQVDYLTNSSMMEVDFLPEHLVIVGGSYIGLEFAQMYRRFGSRVTIVEMSDRLIAREDEDVSSGIREILEAEGVEVRLEAECITVEKRGDGVSVGVSCETGAPEVIGSDVLMAVGRRPNTDDLGLDKAGVETDDRGFIANRMREEGIDFKQCANAFIRCSAPERLQQLADSLDPRELLTCGQKWLARLTPFFTAKEREEAGCQHRLFFSQIEFCDNLIFRRRAALDNLGERLLDANRTIGQPNKISVIFGRRVSKHHRGKLQTEIEDMNLSNPVIRSRYGNGFIK